MLPRIPSAGLVLAAASVLAAGCATQPRADSQAATAPAAAAAPAPAVPPPPVVAPAAQKGDNSKNAKPKAPTGWSYAQVTKQMIGGNAKKTKAALVGKTVTLNLAKVEDPDRLPGLYAVQASDLTFFRCRSAAPGFKGGEVTAKIRDYLFVDEDNNAIIDLDRCVASAAPSAPVAAAPVPVAAPVAAPAPAAPAPVAAKGGAKAGLDAQGNVIDSTLIEAGSGRTVKGINGYEGEITGNPARNSKFTQLQIGMSWKQVVDLAGEPTDSGAYVTGKAWIPFYFGGDRTRMELTYKGQGRLIFAGGSMGNVSGGNLIWIIHNPNESGYR